MPAVYTIAPAPAPAAPPPASKPTFAPPTGSVPSGTLIAISDSIPGAVIYYTQDGTDPNLASQVYAGPVAVTKAMTLKAIATAGGFSTSDVSSAIYTIALPQAAAPVFSPSSGTFPAPTQVTISSSTIGAKIYYTTDNTAPTTSSNLYSTPITISSSQTIQPIAVATGFTNSAPQTAVYSIQPSTGDRPALTPH